MCGHVSVYTPPSMSVCVFAWIYWSVFLPVCLLMCKRVIEPICARASTNTCVSNVCSMSPTRACMCTHMDVSECVHAWCPRAFRAGWAGPRDLLTPQDCLISDPEKSVGCPPTRFLPALTPSPSGRPPSQMAPSKNQDAAEEIPSGSFWASWLLPWRDPELSAVETTFLEGVPAPRGQDPGPRMLGFSGAGSPAGSSFMIPPSFDTALLENNRIDVLCWAPGVYLNGASGR